MDILFNSKIPVIVFAKLISLGISKWCQPIFFFGEVILNGGNLDHVSGGFSYLIHSDGLLFLFILSSYPPILVANFVRVEN